jgi:List-Bact-rpt repeat protein/S-layer family protein
VASRPVISFLAGTVLALTFQVSPLAAQETGGPKTVSVIRLSPTEEMGTVQGLPAHQAHGTLKAQPPPPPPVDLEEREEKQPEVPMIESGINIPPQQTVETGAGATKQVEAPGTFTVFRDSSLAPSGFVSNVSEPNVGSQGDGIFTTHNWYAEVSTNNGSSFSYASPFSTFPSSPAAFSAGFCCDQRVAQDASRDLIFWYLQYIKNGSSSSSTNGVRLAVTHGQAGLASNSWLYYDFTPALLGLPAGTWLDFPQMQASANYLYFTSNVFTAVGDSYYGAVVVRIPLSQLASGSSLTFNYLTVTGSYGSIMPVNGATAEGTRAGRTTMYFAAVYSSTSIVVLTWPESSTSVTINTVSGLATTSFATYACPGPGGLDPCTRASGRMQTGWITDSELGLMWTSAQNGASRPYPYIRVAILNPSTLAVISQPDIFNTTSAWLYPAMSVNERGHLAGTADYLGGTQYPTIAAVIRDDLSPDPTASGWEAYAIAGSTAGTPGRYGDYNGSLPHEKYPKTWLAAGHTQVGGSDNASAVVHNYWFGRERDSPVQSCYALTRTHTGSGSDPSASPGNSSGCSAGQYTAGAVVQLTASPSSGWNVGSWSGTDNNGSTSASNSVTMPAGSRTVTVNYVQPQGSASILLVDDDDNSPDVESYYATALNALGKTYDIWDTGNSDNEPGAVVLQSYKTVLWFSGHSFGGFAGPGASGEADLATFLSGGSGRCLVLSGQDYLFDRGETSFMFNYLGLGSAANDVAQSLVLGQGSAFSGLGPYALSYPFTNFSDLISPAAGAESAFSGDQGNAAISRIGPNHRTIFLGFPFEALPTSQARQEVMAAALDYCATVFADVPPKYWSRKFIEAIYRAGVTNGCAQSPLRYCPEDVVTRGSMAQLLIAAKDGPNYVPPPCASSPFSDVPAASPICPWVQELVHRGVTAGCGGGQYCPNNPVTRSQMSVFLLSTWHGAGYSPAPCTGSAYNDVPSTSPFCPWIKEMAARGITAGCGGGAFCTESPNTRAQLAVFLATTFGFPLQ